VHDGPYFQAISQEWRDDATNTLLGAALRLDGGGLANSGC